MGLCASSIKNTSGVNLISNVLLWKSYNTRLRLIRDAIRPACTDKEVCYIFYELLFVFLWKIRKKCNMYNWSFAPDLLCIWSFAPIFAHLLCCTWSFAHDLKHHRSYDRSGVDYKSKGIGKGQERASPYVVPGSLIQRCLLAPTEAPPEAPTETPPEQPTQAPIEAPLTSLQRRYFPREAPTEAPTEAPNEAMPIDHELDATMRHPVFIRLCDSVFGQ